MASTSKKDEGPASAGAEDELLRAAVRDAVRLCERRSAPRFLGFLDGRQRAVAAELVHTIPIENAAFWGGYPEAERVYFGVFPDYMAWEDGGPGAPPYASFPLTALGFRYRKAAKLTHRDFLGTLLSCGVKRETVGDILCGEGLAVAFLDRGIAGFLAGQIEKVGGEGVTLLPDYDGVLPGFGGFQEMRDTVASPRLDAVVKVAAGISREEAARRIEAGLVSVNHIPCLSVSAAVKQGDILSLRGVGRFAVGELGPLSRKGRLFITIRKYL
ncbi:MAG TPA: hypothetical protein H9674_07125 [Firmicutes bacterium]|nr:hypothetical protein [Bacillota bacterium]